MKKLIKLSAAALLALSMAACSSSKPAEEPAKEDDKKEETAAETGTGVYDVTNLTGETVKELYLYNTGSSDKGENYAGEGMANDAVVELTRTLPATKTGDAVYTLEFVTESGYVGTFDTLHFEVAPIYLLSKDMMTGATMISFKKPE